MRRTKSIARFGVGVAVACSLAAATLANASDADVKAPAPIAKTQSTGNKAPVDRSGRKQIGMASYYGHRFANRRTASGQKMDPNQMTAASKTLPLGTVANVTNLATGKSADVEITDRGPVAKNRIVDVTPKVADAIGLDKKEGVAPVAVKPLAEPPPKGAVNQTGN